MGVCTVRRVGRCLDDFSDGGTGASGNNEMAVMLKIL